MAHGTKLCETCGETYDWADDQPVGSEHRCAAVEPQAWQPITTAPTDGTKVLVVRKGRVAIAWFDPDRYLNKPVPFWAGTDAQLFGKTWAKTNQPSLWMPLPTPPTDQPQS